MFGTQSFGPVTVTVYGSDVASVHVANSTADLEAALTGVTADRLEAWYAALAVGWDESVRFLADLGFTEEDEGCTVTDPTGITHLLYPTSEGE